MSCDEGFCEFCGDGPACIVCGRGGRRPTPIPTRAVYATLDPYPTAALRELISDAAEATDHFTDDELEEFARNLDRSRP